MAWETCDPPAGVGQVDDTLECPGVDVSCDVCAAEGCGNGLADDSRLFKVKRTTTAVVEDFTSRVQFSLARFHQAPEPFSCDTGGWLGGSFSCVGETLGNGFNSADILVNFSDDPTDLLEWIDRTDNFDGTANPALSCALCDDCRDGCDKELRPTGSTPLAGSLHLVRRYVTAVRASDPESARPYAVVLLTDGANNCLDPANPADDDPTPEQAAAICATGVPVHVVGFSALGLSDVLDLIATSGCGPACQDPDGDGVANCDGKAIIVDSEAGLTVALSAIVGSALVEICNGLDDDCDGETDEGVCGGPDGGADGGAGPVCSRCEPHTQGYWHRQCVGCGWIESAGQGPGEHPDYTCDELLALFEVTDVALASSGQATCQALDAMPASDACERALKQYAASLLNVASGRVTADCEIRGTTSVDDLLVDMGARIAAGECQAAAALADEFNTGARCPERGATDGGAGDGASDTADKPTFDAALGPVDASLAAVPATDAGTPPAAPDDFAAVPAGPGCACNVGQQPRTATWAALWLGMLLALRSTRR